MRRSDIEGFTLVELVVVLVIIGILAVFAVPKMINLGHDARIAQIKNLHGVLDSEMHMANEACIIQSGCSENAINSSSMLSGQVIGMRFGYPSGVTDGMINLFVVDDGFQTKIDTNLRYTDFALQDKCMVRYYDRRDISRKKPKIYVDIRGC